MRVSEYALGAGNFGTRWGTGADPDTSRAILDRFAEAGGTFIDTANSYQFGESEEILGALLGKNRDEFVLATKFTNPVTPDASILAKGNSRKTMTRTVEDSLRRLDTDYLDLLWVHFPDSVTPTEEIMHGLDALATSGKILHAGFSNFPAWRVSRAVTYGELRGIPWLVAIQTEYSLAERTADRDLFPMAEALGLGTTIWSPLAGGFLTGKYRTANGGGRADTALKHLLHNEQDAHRKALLDTVLAVADEQGATAAEVSMAWLREHSARLATTSIPIIGPRTVAQLDDYLGAFDVTLTPGQFERLTAASDVPLGQPHERGATQLDTLLGPDRARFEAASGPVA
ncbi:aldo/keto reductase [Amycolatopsis sp.]|uniref:aldo/keto reductase n=1 Tax=Amycolatopsis sp. TaxID=37632 RepID=UPI002C047918|nr:aldo/keto reductase [Amycolatopsis sp.]HVV12594.1 aldo/keto reductase [Amycolatopsis sp.]